MMPGVPAAGHLSDRGYWHPGGTEGCPKCEPPARRRVGDAARRWCPYPGCDYSGSEVEVDDHRADNHRGEPQEGSNLRRRPRR